MEGLCRNPRQHQHNYYHPQVLKGEGEGGGKETQPREREREGERGRVGRSRGPHGTGLRITSIWILHSFPLQSSPRAPH